MKDRHLVSGLSLISWVFPILLSSSGCAAPPRESLSLSGSDWLSETGFSARSTWPSSRLHLSKREIGYSGHLTDLLRKIEGVRIRRNPRQGWGVEQLDPASGETCEIHLYVNGARHARSRSGAQIGLDEVVPKYVIDGLEYHHAPDGPVYEPDGCGSLLVWSERLRTPHDRLFHGSIIGKVESAPPDSVLQVTIEPGGIKVVPDQAGRFSVPGLLPGEYEVSFHTSEGPVTGQAVRVYAFLESEVQVQVERNPKSSGPG